MLTRTSLQRHAPVDCLLQLPLAPIPDLYCVNELGIKVLARELDSGTWRNRSTFGI